MQGRQDSKGKRYHEIAAMLNRDDRTIWATYTNSKKKSTHLLKVRKTSVFIPLSILKNRQFSVLESIVAYLKDSLKFSFNEISLFLKKDYQTIYTTYKNALKKK